jgi:CelD/BcsL family acetyltransferase involved in cellulose biosynthesis
MYLSTVDTREGFAPLHKEWDELRERSRATSPFLSHVWLEAWWNVYSGARDRLCVVECRAENTGRLIGLLPAYIRTSGHIIPARRLRLLGDAHVGSTRLSCIADEDTEADVWDALADHLLAIRNEWDVLELRGVEAEDGFCAHLVHRFGEEKHRVRQLATDYSPTIVLPDSWDDFMLTLSKEWRRKVRKYRQNMEGLGVVKVECIEDPDMVPAALGDVARLFEQSMRRKYDPEFAASDRYVRFITSVTEPFLALGLLRLIFLKVGERRVAFVYQLRHGDTMSGYQTGFETSLAPLGAGMALFSYAIEDAIEQGCRMCDFGPGLSNYKLRWKHSHIQEYWDTQIYGKSVAGVSSAAVWSAEQWAKRTVKRVAPESLNTRLTRTVNVRRAGRL